MSGVVRVVLSEALLDELVADLEQRFLDSRDTLSGFYFRVQGCDAEFIPEIGIRYEPPRLFVRESRALRYAAKGVIHDPVQPGEKWHDLLSPSRLIVIESFFGGADRQLDKEVSLNRRFAKVQTYLCFDGDGFKKLIRQKNLFTL